MQAVVWPSDSSSNCNGEDALLLENAALSIKRTDLPAREQQYESTYQEKEQPRVG
jgi:hypothetical protein